MQLITPRLVLRDFRLNDFDALRALESHPETYRYEGDNPSEEKTRLQLAKLPYLPDAHVGVGDEIQALGVESLKSGLYMLANHFTGFTCLFST